jgi:hypothetical protein
MLEAYFFSLGYLMTDKYPRTKIEYRKLDK